MNEEELKSHVFTALNQSNFSPASRLSIPHIILIRGRRVKLGNKIIWANVGAAKSALRTYLNSTFDGYKTHSKLSSWQFYIPDSEDKNKTDWVATRKAIKEAQDEWVRLNVNFVPISDYINSLKKAGKIK